MFNLKIHAKKGKKHFQFKKVIPKKTKMQKKFSNPKNINKKLKIVFQKRHMGCILYNSVLDCTR